MRMAGFALLLAGWALVLSALTLLRAEVPRTVFTLAGMAVEVLGLGLAFRSHIISREGRG